MGPIKAKVLGPDRGALVLCKILDSHPLDLRVKRVAAEFAAAMVTGGPGSWKHEAKVRPKKRANRFCWGPGVCGADCGHSFILGRRAVCCCTRDPVSPQPPRVLATNSAWGVACCRPRFETPT
jgi:hypothetical protein